MASPHCPGPSSERISPKYISAERRCGDPAGGRRLDGRTSTSSLTGPGFGLRLIGRRSECQRVDRFLADVLSGQGGALVIDGEPGVGKTALLDYAVRSASVFQLVRAEGVESEMELPYSALHLLCLPMIDRIEQLPPLQRSALEVAFGRATGEKPDRLLLGLALLTLFCEVAEGRPLLCVVDDFQWLDRASAQVLEFVARRLVDRPVGLVFATRHCRGELHGLPGLMVSALTSDNARALLRAAFGVPLGERVLDRIVHETGGNPLALVELAHTVPPEELAGGFWVPDAAVLADPAHESLRQQLTALPEEAQQLLLVAAAEQEGDPVVVRRAADVLGIETDTSALIAEAGLVAFGARVWFRRPFARSLVYRRASPADRRTVHGALAGALDPDLDPAWRAWHRGRAALEVSEDVASDLERSSGRARARGGLAAQAAFHERAAELTPDAARRAMRTLVAAQSKRQAGLFTTAGRLLAAAQAGPLDENQGAQADLLDAELIADSGHSRRALPLLLSAAQRLEMLDAGLVRRAHLGAFRAALTAGRLAVGPVMLDVAKSVLRVDPGGATCPERAGDLLLHGLAVVVTQGHHAGVPILKQALSAFREMEVTGGEGLDWLVLACRLSHDAWDDDSWDVLSTRLVELARDAGALDLLPVALVSRAEFQTLRGEFAVAASMVEEAAIVAAATGNTVASYGALMLAAWRGRASEVEELNSSLAPDMVARGEGQWLTAAHGATALLSNGLGHYHEALGAAEQACEYSDGLGLATRLSVELIEAAVRTGSPERAASAHRRLSESATASGTDWAVGVLARSEALLSDGDSAEALYREAIARLGRARVRVELARAQLLYGEWLRRRNRRVAAREQLRAAYDRLHAMGADGFAERARRELLATGETVRKRTVETLGDLTAQEAQIARLASQGRTNPEIGAELYISHRTVEWHLRKVFTKLDINSRRELGTRLPLFVPTGSRSPVARLGTL